MPRPETPSPDAHRFPAGFLLGASTAAHQIEGGNVNSDWWAMEHAASTIVQEPSGDARGRLLMRGDDHPASAAHDVATAPLPAPHLPTREALIDARRIAYTDDALTALAEAMADGADVRGYLHWSLLDNHEWGSYRATFGLIGWDPETFERTPKPSARWLGEVARSIEPT